MKPSAALALIALVTTGSFSLAQDAPAIPERLWELSIEELWHTRMASIASGTPTPLDKAAAVTTVITADEIKAMGASHLDEVLRTVPGLHVARSEQVMAEKYVFRGISSSYNPQALVLLNGIPQTSLIFGNRGLLWGGLPVQTIERVEVIRGPGSALYGADAFAGVINVITKTPGDVNGSQVGARVGSFDSYSAWAMQGTKENTHEVGFSAEYSETGGYQGIIATDAQTIWDRIYGTSASLAPGLMNTSKKMLDTRLELAAENLRLRLGYQGRYDVGTGPGGALALDPGGFYASDRVNLDLSHSLDRFTENWSLFNQFSYLYATQDPTSNNNLYPAGAFGGAFPEGFGGNPGGKEHGVRLQTTGLFRGFTNHQIRIGAGFAWADLYQVTETKNFNPDFSPRAGGLESVAGTSEIWLPEKQRTSYFGFLQDEWQLTEDFQLTSGIRYDHYSDFDSAFNPRAALVWAVTDTFTTKFLYGRAFRAPSFQELYLTSNPVALGNDRLKPELIDTFEIAFSHAPTTLFHYSLNFFHFRIQDFITYVPTGARGNQAQNLGRRKGSGGELEVGYWITPGLRVLGNYAYQRITDRDTGLVIGEAPNHQVYVRSDWEFIPLWHLHSQYSWLGEQRRESNDPRAPLTGYSLVDVTLRTKALGQGLEAALSVKNALDADARAPSPGPTVLAPGQQEVLLPGDIPLPGRSIFAELQYSF